MTMRSTSCSITVIVPAYNESERIVGTLRAVDAWLAAHTGSSEILVVDDGSTDRTALTVRGVADELERPIRVVRYKENRGKGFALKVGFEQARGEKIVFMDADLSVSADQVATLIEQLDAGADIVIGSRGLLKSKVRVRQPWYRVLLGGCFSLLVRLFVARCHDATCGFKAYQRDVGRDLFSRTRIDDWAFDAEVLMLAGMLGYVVKEIPVRWEDRIGTRVQVWRDVKSSLFGLVAMTINRMQGLYDEPRPSRVALDVWDAAHPDGAPAPHPDASAAAE
jgi:dolichyl-phosphate beta-glucosyltransferase